MATAILSSTVPRDSTEYRLLILFQKKNNMMIVLKLLYAGLTIHVFTFKNKLLKQNR